MRFELIERETIHVHAVVLRGISNLEHGLEVVSLRLPDVLAGYRSSNRLLRALALKIAPEVRHLLEHLEPGFVREPFGVMALHLVRCITLAPQRIWHLEALAAHFRPPG